MGEGQQGAIAAEAIDRRYRIRREIARGSIASVYETEHEHLQRRVAVKVLRDELRASRAHGDRLLAEASTLAAARHPNIVEVVDAGECAQHGPFLALEMIQSRSLDSLLVARRFLPIAATIAIARHLANALVHAHTRGVVHRDVKPSNVLLTADPDGGERAKLIDFGAAIRRAVPTPSGIAVADLVGTPEHMAPELFLDEPATERTDVYGLAATIYECLVGEPPYRGSYESIVEQLRKDAAPSAIRARRPEVSEALEAAVMRGLSRRSAARHGSPAELAAACEAAVGVGRGRLDLLGVPPPPPAPGRRASRPDIPAAAPPVTPAASAAPGGGKRKFLRAAYAAPLRAQRTSGSALDGRIEDISEGGVLAILGGALDELESVQLRFCLPMSGRAITVDAVARWRRQAAARAAVGFEFQSIGAAAREEIRLYALMMSGGG